jgi:hypothetical protein
VAANSEGSREQKGLANRILWTIGGMVACSAPSPSTDTEFSAIWQGLDLPECQGEQVTGGEVLFPYSRVRMRPLACIEEGRIFGRWVDIDTGRVVEPSEEEFIDGQMFTSQYDRMDEHLEARIAEVAAVGQESDELFLASVWYFAETPHVVDRDALMSSRAAQDQLTTETRQAYAEVSAPLMRAIEHVGATVMSDSNLGFPIISVRATPAQLREIGRMGDVVRIMLNGDTEPGFPATEVYYDVDLAGAVHASFKGAGIKIANLEVGAPDSSQNLPLAPGSSCVPLSGPSYDCACTSGYILGDHPRITAGPLANTVSSLRGGLAPDSVIYTANTECGEAHALNWAVSKGVTVVSRTYGHWDETGQGLSGQLDVHLKMDHVAVRPPYPFMAASAGNQGNSKKPANLLKNGVIVGGSNDNGSTNRSNTTLAPSSMGTNPQPGWEFPHIVAPSVGISTAGFAKNAVEVHGGTSLATPQVAGTAASIQSGNANIKAFPMAMMASILVGPERNVHGAWPLSFHDAVDDQDGTGSLNSYLSAVAGVNRRTQGEAYSLWGHDRWIVPAYGFPAWTWIAENYNARASHGSWLRAAAVLSSSPACNSSGQNCTGNPHPQFYLGIFDTSGNQLAYSWHGENNWQYVALKNTSGSTKNYKLKVFVSSWQGVSWSEFGIAWVSSAGQ